MAGVRGSDRRIVVVAHVDTDDSGLCALWDDGEVIRITVNSHHAAYAMIHAERHVALGFDGVQICALACADA